MFTFVKQLYYKSLSNKQYYNYRNYDYYAQRKFDLNQFVASVPHCLKEEGGGFDLLESVPKLRFLAARKFLFDAFKIKGEIKVKSFKKIAHRLKVKTQVGYQGGDVVFCQKRIFSSEKNLLDVEEILFSKHKFLNEASEQWYTHEGDLHFFKRGFHIELVTVFNYKHVIKEYEDALEHKASVGNSKHQKKKHYIRSLT